MQILNDFNTTVKKALEEIDPNYMDYPGLVVCGTHSPHDVDFMIEQIREARENNRPFLGICFGHQLAAIEYARNVLGIERATSEEFFYSKGSDLYKSNENVVVLRKEGLKVGLHNGETYWNNFEVKEGFETIWIKSSDFITCQYHPEYQSSKDKPHPLLIKFIELCKKK